MVFGFALVGVYNMSLTILVEAGNNRNLAISDLTNRMGSSNVIKTYSLAKTIITDIKYKRISINMVNDISSVV